MRRCLGVRKAVLFLTLLVHLSCANVFAQFYPQVFETTPGTIGLTLSGGAAKGLAHIGVLHVIDSLGIKIDYISGTSMGAIVGGLYASGFSALEIEDMALTIDWETMFAARPYLGLVHPRNRRNTGKSMIDVPIEQGKFRMVTGAIEGPHLWTTLEAIFFHVRTIQDFSQFPIPYACVATDLETGEAVVLNDGDIVNAIRASMAIPAVFSVVERDGRTLIDGGAVNNFPVDVVKGMGAEYVIGVQVSEGLRPAEKLRTPLDIIYQLGMFKDAYSFAINREMTDMFIRPNLDGYGATSFSQAAELIEQGKQAARRFMEDLLAIASNNPRDLPPPTDLSLLRLENIIVDTLILRGLDRIREGFVNNKLQIEKGDTINAETINRAIRRLYATDYFDRINYTYEPVVDQPDRHNLVFTMIEKPFSSLSTAIHYNSFSGVEIIAGLSSNKFLLYNLNSFIMARIGEQPAYRATFDIYTSDRQRTWVRLLSFGDVINFPVFDRFEAVARYRQSYLRTELSINRLAGPNAIFSIGAASYRQWLTPTMRTGNRISGNNSGLKAFSEYSIYSLNRHDLPQRGQNITLRAAWFFNQDPVIRVDAEQGPPLTLKDLGITIQNFLQLSLNWESYVPVHSRLTLFTHVQGGYNHNNTQGFINMFNMGGTSSFLRDQIIFSGLREYEVLTASAISLALGWHYNFWSDFYLTPQFNAALYDFDKNSGKVNLPDKILMGAGLSFGFLSPAGPLSATVAYSPQSGRVTAYVNLGWAF